MNTNATFRACAPLSGSPDRVLDVAQSMLLAQGFELRSRSRDTLFAQSPGRHSSHQPHLTGANTIAISVSNGQLEVVAGLDGVRRLQLFILLCPLALAVLLGLLFYGVLNAKLWWLSILWYIPWIILSPLMALWIRRRTELAVSSMVRSLQVCGG